MRLKTCFLLLVGLGASPAEATKLAASSVFLSGSGWQHYLFKPQILGRPPLPKLLSVCEQAPAQPGTKLLSVSAPDEVDIFHISVKPQIAATEDTAKGSAPGIFCGGAVPIEKPLIKRFPVSLSRSRRVQSFGGPEVWDGWQIADGRSAKERYNLSGCSPNIFKLQLDVPASHSLLMGWLQEPSQGVLAGGNYLDGELRGDNSCGFGANSSLCAQPRRIGGFLSSLEGFFVLDGLRFGPQRKASGFLPKADGENSQDARKDGRQKPVVSITNPHSPKENELGQMILGALFCMSIFIGAAYLIRGRQTK